MIICEKNRELELLKNELETNSVTMELPKQLSMELPDVAHSANVDGPSPTTIGLQRANLLQPVKVSLSSGLGRILSQPLLPPIITCVTLATAGQTKVLSQLLGKIRGKSLL